jgi:hypothetical protein
MSIVHYEVYCNTEAKFVDWFLTNTSPRPSKCPNSDAHTIDPTKTLIAAPAPESVATGLQVDSDGAPLSRTKAAPTGFTFQERGIEFMLGTDGSLVTVDSTNTQVNDCTLTLYDVNNEVVTGAGALSTAVKTVVDILPPYDFYLLGGLCRLIAPVQFDARISVVAAPDIPYNVGGSRAVIQGMNLRYFDDVGIEANGQAAKALLYNNPVPGTNKLRFIVYHPTMSSLSLSPGTSVGIFLQTYRQ